MTGKTISIFVASAVAVLLLGVSSLFWWNASKGTIEQEEVMGDMPNTNDPFVLAEYYFNADENPNGPYDLKKARFYYEQAIMASSTANESAWHQLGRIDFIEGQFDSAIHKFNTQLELFGDAVPNVYYMIGLTYGYKARESNDPADWYEGEKAFQTFIGYALPAPWPRVDLAWLYFAQGKYEEMKPVLEDGLMYEPQNPWLHNMYGLALLNTDRKDEARTHFELALEYANALALEEWGRAYPGNDPDVWGIGLDSFKDAIKQNLRLATGM